MRERRSQGLLLCSSFLLLVSLRTVFAVSRDVGRMGATLWKSCALPCDVNESHQVSVDAAIRDKGKCLAFSLL